MDIHSARNVIASVRSGGATGGFNLGGYGKTASGPGLISPRLAGVALGLTFGNRANDARIAILLVAQTAQTQAFLNQMARLASTTDLDIQHVGRMCATDPAAPHSGGHFQQVHRPVVAGASVGNFREDSAGTLGGYVTSEDGTTHILSNNHVLANSSMTTARRAVIGDHILQPGPCDGGTDPQHAVASLSGWVPIDPVGYNYVDCAMAHLPGGTKFKDLYGGRSLKGWRAPRANERVFKVGRTTGLTEGQILVTETGDFPVRYNQQDAYFDEQIAIQGEGGRPFSEKGDSGALIVSREDDYAVGLLFAGNPARTLACPLDRVLGALGVTLVL